MRIVILIGLFASSYAVSAPGAKESPTPKPSPLVGEWLLVRLTTNGKNVRWTHDESVFIFMADGKYDEIRDGRRDGDSRVKYLADDKLDPPTLDLIIPANEKGTGLTYRWLYKVEGDTLSICTTGTTIRPKDFAAGKGSKNEILHFDRVKPKK